MKYLTSVLPFIILCTMAAAQQGATAIALNQVGFYTFGTKKAYVVAPAAASHFYIVATNARDTFFTGRLGAPVKSRYSALITREADFTPLPQPGSYMLQVDGVGFSYVFTIGAGVLQPIANAALKGFYYQRSSGPLPMAYAGRWHRGAGHPDTAVLVHPSAASPGRPAGTTMASPGGWYDAGDYNKYIVNCGITMGTLLSAAEDFEVHIKALPPQLPERANKVPDIINECVYNLRWMLTMQDPADGGVYHKCTNASFDGMVMPGITRQPRYVVQKGTAATLDFAAVTAQAARLLRSGYGKAFPKLADSCQAAAMAAWQWALQHPAVVYDQQALNKNFSPAITTGAYGDKQLGDEWFWAAAEMLATTGQRSFYDTVLSRFPASATVPSWASVATLGLYTLARQHARWPAFAASARNRAKNMIVKAADNLLPAIAQNAFGTVMGQSVADFMWGSNAHAANQAILLVNAYRVQPQQPYLNGALSNVDYILGRNATGYCFVTGAGSKSPMQPHHRPSEADGITEPVPGLLVGGPNPGMQDKCAYPATEPETAYSDTECSYASNEIAINWNAPLVYIAYALEALQKQVGWVR